MDEVASPDVVYEKLESGVADATGGAAKIRPEAADMLRMPLQANSDSSSGCVRTAE